MEARYSILGCTFELRADAAIRRAVEDRLPPAESAAITIPLRSYSVARDGGAFAVARARRRPTRVETAAAAADLVVDDLELSLSRVVEARIFVHAGAVAWRGGAILLPGRSGSGKSELVHALVRAGAGYLSDEFAVLDREGDVHPYRRPLALRRADGVRRIAVPDPNKPPLPVSRIAFLRYRENAEWKPSALTPGAAILGLLRNTLSCRRRLEDARRIARRAVADAAIIEGNRPDAARTAAILLGGG